MSSSRAKGLNIQKTWNVQNYMKIFPHKFITLWNNSAPLCLLRFRLNFIRKRIKSLDRWTSISRFVFVSTSWPQFPRCSVLERPTLFWAVQQESSERRPKIIQNVPAGNNLNCQQPPECVLLQSTVLPHLLFFGTVLLKKIFSVARSTCGCEAPNSS